MDAWQGVAAEPVHLVTADGVRLAARHVPAGAGAGAPDLLVVLAHGFTMHADRPELVALAQVVRETCAVLVLSSRGHGPSAGESTVGNREVLDVDAAVAWARAAGYRSVATWGFSMGGTVVVRHAGMRALAERGTSVQRAPAHPGAAAAGYGRPRRRGAGTPQGLVGRRRSAGNGRAVDPADAHRGEAELPVPDQRVDAVVTTSAPSRWFVRDTRPMRIVHVAVTTRAGRWATRRVTGTRITGSRWNPVPLSPVEVAGAIPPVPLLVVHGEEDPFVGPEHGRALARAAGPTADLWVIRGMGHAENAVDADLAAAVVGWIVAAVHGLRRPTAPPRDRRGGTA